MSDLAVASESAITVQHKQAALDAVLHSQTFARADQLKSFLKYVCEMELAGRGHELTEYLIGVEALGRSPNYSPGDDSAVRNRAFALRKKLQEYYEHEQPDFPLRIELTKGSYCPHFIEHHSSDSSLPQQVSAVSAKEELLVNSVAPDVLPEVAALPTPVIFTRTQVYTAFLSGVILTALCAGVIYVLVRPKLMTGSSPAVIAPILTEAWGPILAPNADVLMCVANPPSLAVHDESEIFNNDPTVHQAAPDLKNWIKPRFRTTSGNDLFLSITTNSTYWGDSLGAMATLKILSYAGLTSHILPEKVTTVSTLRRRNVILFGAPEYSPAITHFLEKCPLSVSYLRGIVSQEDASNQLRYAIKRDQQFHATEVYGLITVLPSESSTGDQHRTVIFSGVNSAGAQAAAEFFSSPENLLELQTHLKKEGYERFPPAYQVVVKADPDDNLLLSFKYETHRVISAPTGH